MGGKGKILPLMKLGAVGAHDVGDFQGRPHAEAA